MTIKGSGCIIFDESFTLSRNFNKYKTLSFLLSIMDEQLVLVLRTIYTCKCFTNLICPWSRVGINDSTCSNMTWIRILVASMVKNLIILTKRFVFKSITKI